MGTVSWWKSGKGESWVCPQEAGQVSDDSLQGTARKSFNLSLRIYTDPPDNVELDVH